MIIQQFIAKYFLAAVIFFFLFFALKVIRAVLLSRFKKIADKTKTEIDDLFVEIIESLDWFFYFFFSFYFSLQFVSIGGKADRAINILFLAAVVFYVAKAAVKVADFGGRKIIERRKKEGESADSAILDLLLGIVKAVIWVSAVLIVLENFGYNISALIAGLGVGGIAIAFALQNILADIFASFSIYFDKPFKIGDFIVVGNEMGTVKKIGIKSTRIQSLQGEEIVISNRELTEVRVHNYGKMEKRRIAFNFSVEYGTDNEKLKKILGIVRQIFSGIDFAEIDRVHFKELGDSGLVYEVVYYIKTSDYNKYMDIRQEINLKLKESFEKERIEFAYPSQKIYLANNN